MKKGTLFEPWYCEENGELNIARYIIGDTVREVEGKLYLKLGDSELYIPVKEIKDYERQNY